jgi:MFS family permease
MCAVFIGFLVIGLALPILPLHVHQGLGLGPVAVGLVTGSQFVAALVTRMWAGSYADAKGAKRAVIAGLLAASAGGVVYMASLRFTGAASGAVLLAGRFVLGAGESFIITGALGWGMLLAGPENTGKVIAWVGTAMYGAFAAGAPLGTLLYEHRGFAAIAATTVFIPLFTLPFVLRLQGVPPTASARASIWKVLRVVCGPGAALALTSVGLASITAFVPLLFAQHEWAPGWAAFTAFALCFMLARIMFGSSADRAGGVRVALVSMVIEGAGQALIWRAPAADIAILGAAVTGLGYSLVYPGLGVEAVRRAPPESRALAMGAYTACLDVALGFGTPLLGSVAGQLGIASVFLAGATLVAAAFFVGLALLRRPE